MPVVPPSRIERERPDALLLLAWNFAAEIVRQQDAHRRRGGRFVAPVPRLIEIVADAAGTGRAEEEGR